MQTLTHSLSSLVQHECIPQAILGMDILCQAKSGMGKTAVFVLATLQQIEAIEGQVSVLVMCHTRELAFQISKEYERFSKYMPAIKVRVHVVRIGLFLCAQRLLGSITRSICSPNQVAVFFGGLSIKRDEETIQKNCPHIVVGTPGRTLALVRQKIMNLKNIKHFVLDECDKMLEQLGMETIGGRLGLQENMVTAIKNCVCMMCITDLAPFSFIQWDNLPL